MLPVVLALVAALATPAPFTLATPAPPAPSFVPLPEIGRTRSSTRACTAYRELVRPSIAAVMRADTRFLQAKDHLATYGDRLDDAFPSGAKGRALDQIDRDGLAMLKETKVLNDALGDPRLAADTQDAQLQAERAALQRLYDAQSARAWVLVNFSRDAAYKNLRAPEGNDPFSRTSGSTVTPPPAPDARSTPSNAYPQLSGIGLADKHAIEGWSTALGERVRAEEIGVVPTLVSLSRGCR